MTDEQIIEFLQDNIDYMTNNDIINSLFRTVGWFFAKLLRNLIDACKNLYDITFGLVDITKWSVLENWLQEYKPLLQAIMILSLVALGIMYMLGKNKKHNVFTSILIFVTVATTSSYLFSQFNLWAVTFKDAVVGTADTSDGNELIRANLYDLLYIDDQIGLKNMTDGNRPVYTSLSADEVGYIKINEVINPDDVSDSDTKKILKNMLVFKSGGASRLEECYNGVAWTSYGNEFYYRYKFNYGTYYLSALSIVVIYICLSYKNLRIIYELFTSRILVTIQSSDLSSKKKVVKLLEGIRDGYYALCFTAISIRTYFLFTEYVNSQVSEGLTRGFIILMVAFCVIDGANIMEKITGIDAGLSSMTGKLLAGAHMIQGAGMMMQQHHQMKILKNQNEMLSGGRTNMPPTSGGNGSGAGLSGSSTEGKGNGMGSSGSGTKGNGSGTGSSGNGTKGKGNGTGSPGSSTKGNGSTGSLQGDGTAGILNGKNTGGKAPRTSDAENNAGENGNNGSPDNMTPDSSGTGTSNYDSSVQSDDNTAMDPSSQELEGNYEQADANMAQMDQELEQGGTENGQYDAEHTYEGISENELVSRDSETGMFSKWEAKSAANSSSDGAEKKAGSKEGLQNFESSGKNAANQDTDVKKKPMEPYADKKENSRAKQSHPAAPRDSTRNNAGQSESSQKTSGSYKKITEEKIGRDHYVGGEAVPRSRRKGTKPKKE